MIRLNNDPLDTYITTGIERTCIGCHKSYPPEMQYFRVITKTGRSYLHSLCKECRDKQTAWADVAQAIHDVRRSKIEPFRYVYFLLATDGDADKLIKIGASANPFVRAQQIRQQVHATNITILGLIPGANDGGTKLEDSLHIKFAHLNVLVPGVASDFVEWFEAAPELVAYIRLNAFQSPILSHGWKLSRVMMDVAFRLPAAPASVIALAAHIEGRAA